MEMIKRITVLMLVLLLGAVIAVIFMPAVSVYSGCGDSSRTRATFHQYVCALQYFKGEYGYYPPFLVEQECTNLAVADNGEAFIQVLTGRDAEGRESTRYGNPRSLSFYTFGESEYKYDDKTQKRMVIDHFENPNILIYIDHDGDGYITPQGSDKRIQAEIMIENIPAKDMPHVSTHDY